MVGERKVGVSLRQSRVLCLKLVLIGVKLISMGVGLASS